jgi:hypothetical protein
MFSKGTKLMYLSILDAIVLRDSNLNKVTLQLWLCIEAIWTCELVVDSSDYGAHIKDVTGQFTNWVVCIKMHDDFFKLIDQNGNLVIHKSKL